MNTNLDFNEEICALLYLCYGVKKLKMENDGIEEGKWNNLSLNFMIDGSEVNITGLEVKQGGIHIEGISGAN